MQDDKRDQAHHPHVMKPSEIKEKANQETTLHGHTLPIAHIIKFVSLLICLALIVLIVHFLWPYFGDLLTSEGRDKLIAEIQDAGWAGVFIVLGIQFLQIVVAFIPGEVVQVAAGIIYGPWFGALIILIGCVLSSLAVYLMVAKLGAPFVRAMIPAKFVDKLDGMEKSGRLTTIVFILFLIPGMPKDVFTYLVPLTPMKLSTFLVATNVARIPGVVISTYAASGLVEGRIWQSVVLFVILAVISIVAILCSNRILGRLEEHSKKK